MKSIPHIGVLHANLMMSIAVRDGKGRVDAAANAEEFREEIKKWAGMDWATHYAALRPYQVEMEGHGYPPGPYIDDGIEESRKQLQASLNEAYNGGYAGRASSYETDKCNIDQRDWRNLSVGEFNRDYFDAGRPLVLFGEGLLAFKNAKHKHDWSVKGLKEIYGEEEVFVSNNQKHRELYSADESVASHGARISLAEYMEEEIGKSPSKSAEDSDPRYCFTVDLEYLSALPDTIVRPKVFQQKGRFPETASQIFALGPTNTGSVFHQHGDAWFALVHGEKRFVMFPTCADNGHTSITPASDNVDMGTMEQWYRKKKQQLATVPADCTLKSGEVIYVPATWYHAVINTGGVTNKCDFFWCTACLTDSARPFRHACTGDSVGVAFQNDIVNGAW
jgi:hypothetical protein